MILGVGSDHPSCGKSHVGADPNIVPDSGLPSEDQMIPGLGTSADRCLRRNQCLFADRDVVGNLNLVVDFATSSDHRSGETGTVDGSSCPDFNIIFKHHNADLGDFLVAPLALVVAMAVSSDHRIGLDDDPVPDQAAVLDHRIGIDFTVISNARLIENDDPRMNPASLPDLDSISDHNGGTDADPVGQFGVICDDGARMGAACRDQRRMKESGRFDMPV